jgi:hypothetical protein
MRWMMWRAIFTKTLALTMLRQRWRRRRRQRGFEMRWMICAEQHQTSPTSARDTTSPGAAATAGSPPPALPAPGDSPQSTAWHEVLTTSSTAS